MTDATYSQATALSASEKNRALLALLTAASLWLGAFLSGFVIAEPAPYELYMVGLIGIWVLLGLRLPSTTTPLIALLVVFNLGGLITLMTMQNWSEMVIYVAVSFFLALTAIFFSAVISEKPERLKAIFSGYMAAAIITATLGILGYFNTFPGADVFTRFDRAKGAFADPNVFAPFLVLPAVWCLQQIMTRPLTRSIPHAVALVVLTGGIFLSFSRAGWGLMMFCAVALTIVLLISNPSNRFRLRILGLAGLAMIALMVALLITLQFDDIREVFTARAQLVQSYDEARLGRFGRHLVGLGLAIENPLGIGILQFGQQYGEDIHNIWLKTLLEYSWLGFATYLLLVVWTLGAGLKIMFRARPWQAFLQCTYIVFVGHLLIGAVIDTDHWRHFFLLLGIIWGCIAAEEKYRLRSIS